MKKNGFTLIELLAVIVILGVLATVSGVAVFSIISQQKAKLLEEQLKNLGDTAVTYVIDKKYILDSCADTFNETYIEANYNSLTTACGTTNKCCWAVSVSDLIDGNYFQNKNNICKITDNSNKATYVIVYKAKSGTSSTELKGYVYQTDTFKICEN